MDLANTKAIVVDICKKAGDNLQKYFESQDLVHTSKGGLDFLTHADLETDAFLQRELKKAFPETEFLTEESSDGNFKNYKQKNNLWIIDPIDGTTNFSRGDKHCAISVGLVNKGSTLLGVVHLPFENKTYWATIDGESFCNDTELHVSAISDLESASIGVDWSWDVRDRKRTLTALEKIVSSIRQPRSLGSAASDICLVAEGKLDGYFIYGLKPWDHAAANLILTNAGGCVSKVDGNEWNVFDGEILATNNLIHKKLLTLLK